MKDIKNMNGKEFEEYLTKLENSDNENIRNLANKTRHNYFIIRNTTPEKSWEEDPDDVWDAENFLKTNLSKNLK